MSHTQTCKLVFTLSFAAAVFILHGLSFFTTAVFFYAAGTAFVKGQKTLILLTVFLCGLSVLSCDSLGPSLLTVGAVLAISFSDFSISRYLFLLSVSAIVLSGVIEGIVPLLAAALAASLLKKELWRLVILAAGFSAVLIISGLPNPDEYPLAVCEEVLTDNGVLWTWTSELDLSMPELLIKDPHKDISNITLQLSAGGVRDSIPVGFVISGNRAFPVRSGENIVLIDEPQFPVSIRMSRHWELFTHPVIHVDSAEASL
jgi:hypothetical protein